MIQIYRITIIILCLIGLSFHLHAENVSDKNYIIGAEDVLEIQVWGQEDMNRTVEISEEGDFTFPFIGKVHADGLSVFDLENLITQKLSGRFLAKPQVSVSVIKYKSNEVYIFGEVRNPGEYILKGKTHLLEVISEAGGFTDMSGNIIKIVRPKQSHNKDGPVSLEEAQESEVITIDIEKLIAGFKDDKFFLVTGDTIYISKAERLFVIGEVKKPGEIKWERGLKVYQAISIAGGPTSRGAPNRTKIIRIEDDGAKKEFKPEMNDIVEPDDILKVPRSFF